MKVLIVFAHPNSKSFNGAMKDKAVEVFKKQGHEVKVSDLYAKKFNPIAGPGDFKDLKMEFFKVNWAQASFDVSDDIKEEQDLLTWADWVVFQFPIWWLGAPAILKGYIDRVFTNKFAYSGKDMKWFKDGKLKGRRALIATTTGAGKEMIEGKNQVMGDLSKEVLYGWTHGVLFFAGMDTLPPYVCYSPEYVKPEDRKKMLDDYGKYLENFGKNELLDFHNGASQK